MKPYVTSINNFSYTQFKCDLSKKAVTINFFAVYKRDFSIFLILHARAFIIKRRSTNMKGSKEKMNAWLSNVHFEIFLFEKFRVRLITKEEMGVSIKIKVFFFESLNFISAECCLLFQETWKKLLCKLSYSIRGKQKYLC